MGQLKEVFNLLHLRKSPRNKGPSAVAASELTRRYVIAGFTWKKRYPRLFLRNQGL